MVILLLIGIFVTCFLILLLLFGRNEKTSSKDRILFRERLKNGNQRIKLFLLRKKKTSKKKKQLARRLTVAGLLIKPEEFIAFNWLIAIIIAGVFHLVSSSFVNAFIGLVIGYSLPKIWLKGKENKRIKQFNDGLPNMLTSIIGSLKAGFSFTQALQMVAEESHSPIKEEVELLLKTMQYGKNTEEALLEWKERMPSSDLTLLVDAVIIQRQAGGNLAYLLNKIVETTRERTKLTNQIKTLTAQGRLSGIIVSGLPVALGFIIYLMNPDYIKTLFVNPIGQMMLAAGLIGGLIGFFMIRKITTIEV